MSQDRTNSFGGRSSFNKSGSDRSYSGRKSNSYGNSREEYPNRNRDDREKEYGEAKILDDSENKVDNFNREDRGGSRGGFGDRKPFGERKPFGDRPPREDRGDRGGDRFNRDDRGGSRGGFGSDSSKFVKDNRIDTEKDLKLMEKMPAPVAVVKFLQVKPASLNDVMENFKVPNILRMEVKVLLNNLVQQRVLAMDSTGRLYSFAMNKIHNTEIPWKEILVVKEITKDGDIIVEFSNENYREKITNKIHLASYTQYNIGDEIIVEFGMVNDDLFAKPVYMMEADNLDNIVGVYKIINKLPYVIPASVKNKLDFMLEFPHIKQKDDLVEGDIVKAKIISTNSYKAKAMFVKKLASDSHVLSSSILAMHEYNLPSEFLHKSLEEANAAEAPNLEGRVDLTDLNFVTIDGEDAKDFDDAVFAEKAVDGKVHAIVAIADVAYYVKENSMLDLEAQMRGNSVYLPGMVLPMLPENLSNKWCSLVPNENRAVLAVHLFINEDGRLENFEFVRAMIKSKARLTYNEVQNVLDEKEVSVNAKKFVNEIKNLNDCYLLLNKNRLKRNALEIYSLDKKVAFDDNQNVIGIESREALTSHKIIEELMIVANVAAANFLKIAGLDEKGFVMFRVHNEPDYEKIEKLVAFLKTIQHTGKLPYKIDAASLNEITKKYQFSSMSPIINDFVLKCQVQAEYNNRNIGHFGLALKDYCHFTSPIRRYADLAIHRLIIKVLNNEEINIQRDDVSKLAKHISFTERQASSAEYSAIAKIGAKFLEKDLNVTKFSGYIATVIKAGMFVHLDKIAVSGLIPLRFLGDDKFIVDIREQLVEGKNTGKLFRIGDKIEVYLIEVDPIRGMLTFALNPIDTELKDTPFSSLDDEIDEADFDEEVDIEDVDLENGDENFDDETDNLEDSALADDTLDMDEEISEDKQEIDEVEEEVKEVKKTKPKVAKLVDKDTKKVAKTGLKKKITE